MNNQLKYGVIGAAAVAILAAAMPADAQPQLRGRIHLDYAFYDEDATVLNDTIRVRRARLGATGRLDDNWSYTSEIDFAENGVDYKDMYLRHNNIGGGRLSIGQLKVPFSLEELTSSNNITFMERSSPNLFSLSRRIGVHYSTSGDNYTFAAMGFGQAIGGGDGGDEGLGIGARVTFTPMKGENSVFHLGAGFQNYDTTNSNTTTMRFRQRPESRPDGSRLIDTGNITAVDSVFAWNLEGAWQSGPFSVQGEYFSNRVKRDAQPNATFDGYYIYGSYFLTGENRRYSGGTFSGPRVGEKGAWELAARYSSTNLDDAGAAILGGEMNNFTIGVNWYPRNNVRFMFNYINVNATVAGVDNDPSILQFRTQVSF